MRRREFIKTAAGVLLPAVASLGAVPSHRRVVNVASGNPGADCDVTLTTYTGGGDTFNCYPDAAAGDVLSLAYGSGFSGAWVVQSGYVGLQGSETFDTYTDGTTVTGLDDGFGFSGAWVVAQNYKMQTGADDFDSYTDGSTVTGLNAGTGWSGDWVVTPM